MKKILFFILLPLFLQSCRINQQFDELKALENCTYKIVSADSVYLAGVDVSRIIDSEGVNFSGAPQLAFALLQKRVPFQARLNFEISNPGKTPAGINEFEYKLLIKDRELTSGIVNQKISIEPGGGTVVVPLKVTSDIYPFISDTESRKAIVDFFSTDIEKKVPLTIKIKPSLMAGDKKINYPGYISIDKEISNKTLLPLLEGTLQGNFE